MAAEPAAFAAAAGAWGRDGSTLVALEQVSDEWLERSLRWAWERRAAKPSPRRKGTRSEEHTSELQSLAYLVCRLLLEKKNNGKHSGVAGVGQADRHIAALSTCHEDDAADGGLVTLDEVMPDAVGDLHRGVRQNAELVA